MHQRKAIASAKASIDRLIRRSTKIANLALQDLTPEQIRAGHELSQSEAPAWVSLVKVIVGAKIKAESILPTPVQNTLNLVLVDRAKSNEDWLQMVDEYKQAQPKVIDVMPEPAKVPK